MMLMMTTGLMPAQMSLNMPGPTPTTTPASQ
jgi:hypothetical protein